MLDHTASDKLALKTLLQMENDLSNRLNQLSVDMTKSHSRDSGEQAVERENDEVVDRLENETEKELQQVQNAIKRIEQGKYHECSKCGGQISTERLYAIPYATLCITCAD